MKLIAGLGNPGRSYEDSRHNLGFRVIDELSRLTQVQFKQMRRMLALVGRTEIAAEGVILAKPFTFMNESGRAIKKLVDYYSLQPPDVVIISDDLDLDLGKMRLKNKSSSGGHKGRQSIIEQLNCENFISMRIGIGRPFPGENPIDYVLKKFSPDEKEIISKAIKRAAQAIEVIIKEGIAKAMSMYN